MVAKTDTIFGWWHFSYGYFGFNKVIRVVGTTTNNQMFGNTTNNKIFGMTTTNSFS